jgi:hypothetical protein
MNNTRRLKRRLAARRPFVKRAMYRAFVRQQSREVIESLKAAWASLRDAQSAMYQSVLDRIHPNTGMTVEQFNVTDWGAWITKPVDEIDSFPEDTQAQPMPERLALPVTTIATPTGWPAA